ncbi:probable cytochrome P450 6a13 [Acyrthosiphon pisum]|uniref:Cytochrome P450 n=1 Tax=Acyrthosiphon pisum TaxID=7029 RepID=A0A8R2ACA1_ACYPI|nr:probable cytochrome P450 6a13 [Acyrthosiphon pisum]|eukprot:XP_001952450.1 PREDICTED: probable cytochrome P450 6a13 [Acyrthosiphon pisum]
MISCLIYVLFGTPAIAAVAVLAAILYYYTTNTYDKWLKLKVPHDPPWPLVGNTAKMMTLIEHQLTTIDGIYKRFSGEKYCGFYQMKTPFLMIRDPELINNILIKDFSNFADRGFHKDPALNIIANGLFFMEGPKWKMMRQKLSPGFTSGKLKLAHNQIAECSDELMRFIAAKMKENDQIEVKETMSKYSTDVIGTCAFGLKLDTVKNEGSDFRLYGRKILKLSFRFLLAEMVSPKILKLLGVAEFPPDASAFYESAFKEVIRYREENGIVRHDVAQSLIEARKELVLDSTDENGFTEQHIIANAILMFLAGFETVSSTLSFCLYHLALNQDVQEKIRDEMNSKLKQHGKINNDFLVNLHYTDMVLAETERMYVVTNALFREAVKTYHVPGDTLVIEKGTKIMIPIYSIHHDPTYYPEPYIFDPQRFSPEEKAKRQSSTYLPFGDGPRFCIGKRFAELEMKMVLSQIITTFRILPCEKTEVPLKLQNGLPMMVAKNGIWLRFQSISE